MNGEVVIVTGGARGLGAAYVRGLKDADPAPSRPSSCRGYLMPSATRSANRGVMGRRPL
jgi:hypothetical protein